MSGTVVRNSRDQVDHCPSALTLRAKAYRKNAYRVPRWYNADSLYVVQNTYEGS